MDYYKGTIPILEVDHAVNGGRDADQFFPKGAAFGLVERDYAQHPQEMFAQPSDMKLYDESEWDALYDEEEAQQSSLEHLYLRGGKPAFVNLDQNGHGYCWAYSTGTALMLTRLKQNQPLVRLNPHSVAAIIKRGADQGGWCGLSAQFVREHGMAEEGNGPGQWPLHSRSLSHDNSTTRASMAKYRSTEEWVDLTQQVYDQNLTVKQYATSLFNRNATPSDFAWWGHSVCALRWVRIERGSWGQLILNSWKGWGRFGLSVIKGAQTRTMGALSIRTVLAT